MGSRGIYNIRCSEEFTKLIPYFVDKISEAIFQVVDC